MLAELRRHETPRWLISSSPLSGSRVLGLRRRDGTEHVYTSPTSMLRDNRRVHGSRQLGRVPRQPSAARVLQKVRQTERSVEHGVALPLEIRTRFHVVEGTAAGYIARDLFYCHPHALIICHSDLSVRPCRLTAACSVWVLARGFAGWCVALISYVSTRSQVDREGRNRTIADNLGRGHVHVSLR